MNYNTLGCGIQENNNVSVRRGKGGRTYDPTGHSPTVAEFERMMLWVIDKVNAAAGFSKAIWQRNLAIISLIRYTGLRINSLLHITIADAKMALKTGVLIIKAENMKNGNKGGVVNPRYEHRVRLSQRAKDALRLSLLAREILRPNANHFEMLFVSRDYASSKKQMTARTIQLMFKEICKQIDSVTVITPHKIRAFFAMMAGAAEKVMPQMRVLSSLQKMLHHSSIKTTMQHYAAAGNEDLLKFAESVSVDEDRLKLRLDEVFSVT